MTYGKDYDLVAAIVVDLIRRAWQRWPWTRAFGQQYHNDHFNDWVAFSTEATMRDVDGQIEELHRQWAEEEAKSNAPVIIEHEPDGSDAQNLLGGTLEIRAPWYKPDEGDTTP